jgi:hypothetical protein
MTLTAPDLEAIAQAVAAAIAPKEWLGPEDAAAYLDLSPQYLAQLRMKKAGPAYHLVGRRCLYRRTDLDAWIAQHRVKTDA